MTRLLLVGIGVLALTGCGGGTNSPVGANSTDSTQVTAVGNVVSTDTSPVSVEAPTPDTTTSTDTPATSPPDSTDGNLAPIQ